MKVPVIPVAWHRELLRAKRQERNARRRKAELKQRIIDRLGGARIGRVGKNEGAYVLLTVEKDAYRVPATTFDDLRHTADVDVARSKLRGS